MDEQFINIIAPVASSLLAAGITWLVARRKNDAHVRKTDAESTLLELRGLRNLISLWRSQAGDLTDEVKRLRTELSRFTVENNELKDKVSTLSLENHELMDEIQKLTDEVMQLRKSINQSNS